MSAEQLTLPATTAPSGKRCYACGRTLPWAEIPGGQRGDGRLPMKCRTCIARDATRRLTKTNSKVCLGPCGTRRPLHDFTRHGHCAGGREPQCRLCIWERRHGGAEHPQRTISEGSTPETAQDSREAVRVPLRGAERPKTGFWRGLWIKVCRWADRRAPLEARMPE